MAHINLLPWRELARKREQTRFMIILGSVIFSMLLCVFGLVKYYDAKIEGQKSRNQFLTLEIEILDEKIKEIASIEEKRTRLEQRMRLVEQLQSERNIGTLLFNELAHAVPSGVFLENFTRRDSSLLLVGQSESNNRLSTMMRTFEQSKILKDPLLESITAKNESESSLNEYRMQVKVKTLSERLEINQPDKDVAHGEN